MTFASDFSDVRGFQYQPSYAATLMETWSQFDADAVARELDRGREHFPRMNAIRMRLSWNAFKLDPDAFARNFEMLLALADERDLRVMPELFNRWHNPVLDYGGEYVDHFYPEFEAGQVDAYLDRVVGEHADDDRVFLWDLCNEPLCSGYSLDRDTDVRRAEVDWLEHVADRCSTLETTVPLTVGVFGLDRLELVEELSDVLTVHVYAGGEDDDWTSYEDKLDEYVSLADRVDKPLLVSETVSGATDDTKHVENVRNSLRRVTDRDLGYVVPYLHYSRAIDCHGPEEGPHKEPLSNMSFIKKDGSLRAGHQVFNEF